MLQWSAISGDDQIWLITQVIITLILIVMFFYFLSQSIRLRDVPSQKHFYLGLSGFVFFNTLTQGMWTLDKIALVFLKGQMSGTFLAGVDVPFVGGGGIIPYLFVFFLCSFTAICWPVEKYVTNSKRFPITTINLIGAISMIVYLFVVPLFLAKPIEGDVADNLEYVMYGVVGIGGLGLIFALILIIGFYMALGGKTSGSVRKKSFLIAFGFMMVFIGLILTQLQGNGLYITLASPAVMIIGFVFLGTGYRIQI